MDGLQVKEFCNRGRGLSAASLRRLQATPLLQTSLLQVSLEHDQRSFFVYSLFHIHPILGIILIQIQIRFFFGFTSILSLFCPRLGLIRPELPILHPKEAQSYPEHLEMVFCSI